MKSINLFYVIGVVILILVLVLNGFHLLSVERILVFEFFSLSFLIFGVIRACDNLGTEMEHLNQVSMAKLTYLEGIMAELQNLSASQGEVKMFVSKFDAQVSLLLDEMKHHAKDKPLDEFKEKLDELSELMKGISVKVPN